ncbi:MAG TPA: hypothetical protein VFR86_13100 [Burkholderiaceae bacterium]|nr:hypothetical protein [Burkholderiaceae bacterium]
MEVREQGRQPPGSERGSTAMATRRPARRVAQIPDRLLRVARNALSGLDKDATFGRRPDRARRAVEQARAQVAFERADQGRERRLKRWHSAAARVKLRSSASVRKARISRVDTLICIAD